VKQDNNVDTSGRYWRSVVRDHWQSLYKTKLAATSPFHGYLVSPGSKRALTGLPNHVDNVSVTHAGKAFGDRRHLMRSPQDA